MAYKSVDELQRLLVEKVFHDRADAKKAAGRALGTIVEIITYYVLCDWDFKNSIAIERRLPEFANPEITHNVEFSLHPVFYGERLSVKDPSLPLTTAKIVKAAESAGIKGIQKNKNSTLLSTDSVLRNSCVFNEIEGAFDVANLVVFSKDVAEIDLQRLLVKPYAVFECKRVGVEEGANKGPTTIEKAKQGAYVARTVSSLQRIRRRDGSIAGMLELPDKTIRVELYEDLLKELLNSKDMKVLSEFVLTAGVVSNHGNWFTAENQNKELKVLAQSYDWLLFLTDAGLAEFLTDVLQGKGKNFANIRAAFQESYLLGKKENKFTKVKMSLAADTELRNYFCSNRTKIASWFNVISPKSGTLDLLRKELGILKDKKWNEARTK